jgi:hypothetical protein
MDSELGTALRMRLPTEAFILLLWDRESVVYGDCPWRVWITLNSFLQCRLLDTRVIKRGGLMIFGVPWEVG